MILFACPSCGRAYKAEDDHAGAVAECHGCGADIPIPQESDPGVVLVFRAGADAAGIPLGMENYRAQVENGELQPIDLILDQGRWRPIGDTCQDIGPRPPAGESLLRLRLAATEDGDQPQIIDRLPAIGGRRSGRRTRAPRAARRRAAGGRSKVRLPGGRTLRWCAAAAAAVLVFVLAWVGLGPWFAQITGRLATVYVVNATEVSYEAALGRSGSASPLPAGGNCKLTAFVRKPRMGTLKLVPTAENTDAVEIRDVPLEAESSVLVNVKREALFAAFDALSVLDAELGDAADALVRQITRNRAPEAAEELMGRFGQVGRDAFEGTSHDQFYDDREYCFVDLRGAPPRPSPGVLLLTSAPECRLQVADGFVLYAADGTQALGGGVTIPEGAIELADGIDVAVPAGLSAEVRRPNWGELNVALAVPDQSLAVGGQVFSGTWYFTGNLVRKGGEEPSWNYGWGFDGTADDGFKATVTVVAGADGKPQVNAGVTTP